MDGRIQLFGVCFLGGSAFVLCCGLVVAVLLEKRIPAELWASLSFSLGALAVLIPPALKT
jgi:hypothetical protein